MKPFKVAAVLVPVVTAVAIAVPIIAGWGERNSGADTLVRVEEVVTVRTSTSSSATEATVDATAPTKTQTMVDPYADVEVIGFTEMPAGLSMGNERLIPVTAPFATFPLNWDEESEDCTTEQHEWLDSYAYGYEPDDWQYLMLRNSATIGGSVSLNSVRFVGDEVDSEAWLLFECPTGPIGGDNFPGQPLMLDIAETAAVWGDDYWSDFPEEPPGSPVTLNIAPGEINQFEIMRAESVDPQRTYRGRLVADVVGDGTPVVLADNFGFTREELSGYRISKGRYAGLGCTTPEWDNEECTLAEAAELLESLALESAGS